MLYLITIAKKSTKAHCATSVKISKILPCKFRNSRSIRRRCEREVTFPFSGCIDGFSKPSPLGMLRGFSKRLNTYLGVRTRSMRSLAIICAAYRCCHYLFMVVCLVPESRGCRTAARSGERGHGRIAGDEEYGMRMRCRTSTRLQCEKRRCSLKILIGSSVSVYHGSGEE